MSSNDGSSDSETSSVSSGARTRKIDVKENKDGIEDTSSSSDSSNSESGSDSSTEDVVETPVLSHAEKRKQKKEKSAVEDGGSVIPVKNTADLAPSKVPRRQNSVWVGNLSFKTTVESLRRFFDEVGEITRVHMPMKLANAGVGGKGAVKENRGFAYVDFATPDAKVVAISLSEGHLDGRRLLIKDGSDFTGRPSTSTVTEEGSDGMHMHADLSGHTKTAQKILHAQKQPAGPTLFFGNLGFETTEQSIRGLLERNRKKADDDSRDNAADKGSWIRKVRMGTFEDSGKCKGWAFVDFTGIHHATDALTNSRNHQLDGRKLVVEYASPEAVRRGGGPRTGGDHLGKTPRNSRRTEGDPAIKRKRYDVEVADADTHGHTEKVGHAEDEQPWKKRRDGMDTGSQTYYNKSDKGGRPKTRAKPGAALALAKREAVAIVPSQGQKIVF